MPVKDADPQAASLDTAFAAAMGTPPAPREPAAPPDVDPDAPFGRDGDGAPLAPFGLTREGRPRRSNAGRKSNDERARVTSSPSSSSSSTGSPSSSSSSASASSAAAAAPADYSAPLAEFTDTIWFGLSALGKGGSAIPLVGRWIPERKLAAEAYVFRSYRPNLVRALNIAAQHNERARRFASTIATGDLTWSLTVGLLVMPFITSSAAIWKDSENSPSMGDAGLPPVAELARRNDEQLDEFLSQLSAQLELLSAAAAAEAHAGLVDELGLGDAELAAAREAGIL